MIKKIGIGLIITIMVSQLTFGQTKVYNGAFKSLNFAGNVTYNYIEEPEKRIFSGPFIFKTSNHSLNISGNYLNDLKNGIWKYLLTNVEYSDLIMKYTINAEVLGSFKDGNLDGTWTLSRTKIISFSNNGVSEYYQFNLNALSYMFDGNIIDFKKSTTMTEKCTANFENNRFAGSFYYSVNNEKSIVTGQFNEQGYFDGTWTVNYFQDGILHLQTRSYLDGVLLTIKNKNNSTGDVVTIYDKTAEVKNFFQNYNSEENSSRIGDYYYKLEEGKSSESSVKLLEDAISIWYNNSSLSRSSYTFEIERGTNKLSAYPERKITFDVDQTEKVNRERETEKEELRKIKLAKEKEELEQRRKEDEKIRIFESTDYGKLQKEIKNEFSSWLNKGEFETQHDFEIRVKDSSIEEFKKISEKVVLWQKNQKLRNRRYAIIGDYDAKNEAFFLPTYDGYSSVYIDEIYIKIPIGIAQNVKSKFSGLYNKENKIIVIPQDYVMIENNWKLSSALIVFNSKFQNATWFVSDKFTINKQSNGNVTFSSRYPTPELKNYKIKNIKESKTIVDDLYFYEWSITEVSFYNPALVQNLNFSIEDLGIVLPVN